MRRTDYFLLLLGGIAITSLMASFQAAPGYMDADYYFGGALRLAEGQGFSEVVLWNYLDDPEGLPHASHGYWMPLASILGWIGLKAFPYLTDFSAARLPFVILAGMIPLITAALTYALDGRRGVALLAGALAILPGFYLPFLATTDTFAVYMVLGGGLLLMIGEGSPARSLWRYLLMGILIGLMHLARTDGVLWLLVAVLVALNERRGEVSGFRDSISLFLARIGRTLCGYLLVMGPWMLRNLAAFGTPLAPGGARVLWLTQYDELFAYPAARLNFGHWLEAGFSTWLGAWLWSLRQNLGSLIVVQGAVLALLFILVGAWQQRGDLRVKAGLLAWGLSFALMTFVFPFPGARGGFFHAGAALQPLLWALAAIGLQHFAAWWSRWRNLALSPARVFFTALLLLVVMGLTGFRTYQRVIGPDPAAPLWGSGVAHYERLEAALAALGARPEDIVMVNSPPSYYVASRRAAVVIPNGDEAVALSAAERYGARFLLLERNHPADLSELYTNPNDLPGLNYLNSVEGSHIFLVLPPDS